MGASGTGSEAQPVPAEPNALRCRPGLRGTIKQRPGREETALVGFVEAPTHTQRVPLPRRLPDRANSPTRPRAAALASLLLSGRQAAPNLPQRSVSPREGGCSPGLEGVLATPTSGAPGTQHTAGLHRSHVAQRLGTGWGFGGFSRLTPQVCSVPTEGNSGRPRQLPRHPFPSM